MIRLEGLKKYFTITKGLMKKEVTYVKAVDDISLEIFVFYSGDPYSKLSSFA